MRHYETYSGTENYTGTGEVGALVSVLEASGVASMRSDCPNCNGKNTLGISYLQGSHRKIIMKCWRVSCQWMVVTQGTSKHSADRAKQILREKNVSGYGDWQSTEVFVKPESFKDAMHHEQALKYLKKVHAYNAYIRDQVEVQYDVQQDRVVFMVRDENGVCVDATGRALSKGVIPKWYRYVKHGGSVPFVCTGSNRMDLAILVEDAASACAVAGSATGVALLGTSMSLSQLSAIKKYPQVLVALDPDARKKSLDIARQIRYFTKARPVLIPDDLKYFSEGEIEQLVQKWMT